MPPEHEAPGAGTAPWAQQAPLRTRPVEAAVAALLLGLAILVIKDSLRLGMRWGDDGPQAGYFPFYIGVLLALASTVTLWRALAPRGRSAGAAPFVHAAQLRALAQVLLPLLAFVVAARWLGLYVAAAVFMAWCMRRLGGYRWPGALAVPAAMVVVLFVLFERWFKVPLIKGPLEALLGLG